MVYQKFQSAEIRLWNVIAGATGWPGCELNDDTLCQRVYQAVFANGEAKTASFPKFEEKSLGPETKF
jgi:hypothetical protein